MDTMIRTKLFNRLKCKDIHIILMIISFTYGFILNYSVIIHEQNVLNIIYPVRYNIIFGLPSLFYAFGFFLFLYASGILDKWFECSIIGYVKHTIRAKRVKPQKYTTLLLWFQYILFLVGGIVIIINQQKIVFNPQTGKIIGMYASYRLGTLIILMASINIFILKCFIKDDNNDKKQLD